MYSAHALMEMHWKSLQWLTIDSMHFGILIITTKHQNSEPLYGYSGLTNSNYLNAVTIINLLKINASKSTNGSADQKSALQN